MPLLPHSTLNRLRNEEGIVATSALSVMSRVGQCRTYNIAELDILTCSNGFLIWHGTCLVCGNASRAKENSSNDHPVKKDRHRSRFVRG